MSRRVDGSLGPLLQGVSQQPIKQRLQGQVTSQDNMVADPVRMLNRRPPLTLDTSLDTLLGPYDFDTAAVHYAELSNGESYYMILEANTGAGNSFHILNAQTGALLQSADIHYSFLDTLDSGNSWTTDLPNYLQSDNPKRDIRFVSIGDVTYLINTTVPTRSIGNSYAAETTSSQHKNIRIDVEVGQYSRNYTVDIVINGTSNPHTHPTLDSNLLNEATVATDVIANELYLLINADANITTHFNIKIDGASILLIPKLSTLTDYTCTVTDGVGGGAMRAIVNGEVTGFGDLPTRAAPGDEYTITGGASGADDIYMRFDVENPAGIGAGDAYYFQNGIWREHHHPLLGTRALRDMPFVLQRLPLGGLGSATGDFALSDGFDWEFDGFYEYAEALVGDLESNSDPDFVGFPITDITVFQNRLVILANEFVHMSVTGDFFNFYKKTVTTLLDDGPIGLAALSSDYRPVRFGAVHDEDLVIFADSVQYIVPGDKAVTPKNATLSETTAFRIQSDVRPAPSGQNLFFAVNTGPFSGVREFYTDTDLNSNNAIAITAQVNKLIPGNIEMMTSSTNFDRLVIKATEQNKLYIYEYLWEQEEKIQSAWSTWTLHEDLRIVHLTFVETALLILAYVGTDLIVLRMEFNTLASADFDHDVYLDVRQKLTVSAGNSVQTVGLPMIEGDLEIIQGPGCPNPGLRANIDFLSPPFIQIAEDMNEGDVYVGVKYRSAVKPTMPRIYDNAGIVIGTSELTVGEMYINFDDAGPFSVDVTGEVEFTEYNPGKVLGEVSATLGEFNLTSGQFPIPVRQQADESEIEIYTDSAYPLTVIDIEWDGQYYKRGSRVTRPR